MDQIRIAIDAMGGDAAPEVVIRGALEYLQEDRDLVISLVGKEKEIKKELKKCNFDPASKNLEIVDALEMISMREQFFSYWRRREKTSIKRALDLVKATSWRVRYQRPIGSGNQRFYRDCVHDLRITPIGCPLHP